MRYGAGSADDGGTRTEKASSPALPSTSGNSTSRKKTDALISQASIHRNAMNQAISSRKFDEALAAFTALEGFVSAQSEKNADLDAYLLSAKADLTTALEYITLEAVSAPAETGAGAAFKTAFVARVSVKAGEAVTPLSGFRLSVEWPTFDAEGNRIVSAAEITTDAEGVARFQAPVPARALRGELVMSAAGKPAFAPASLSITFPYKVAVSVKNLPTTISMLDYDKNGKPVTSSNISATLLLKPLVQKGFTRIGMADFQKQLAAGDDEALLKAAKALFGSSVQRFVYGTVKVQSLSAGPDGVWTCTLTARMTVWSFQLNRQVYFIETTQSETGKTESLALQNARNKMSVEILAQELLYNM